MRLIEKRGEKWDLHCRSSFHWSLSVERVNITFMTYEELLEKIANEVLNEYWKNGNDFIDPSIEVYESYMEKRQPEIERLLKLKQFDSVGIEGQIAMRLSKIIANHPDDRKRKSYKVKDWIFEMAEIAKYHRDCSCC